MRLVKECLTAMEVPAALQTSWTAVTAAALPMDALQAVPELREQLARWEAGLARAALADGETWATIGAALGISRQAAWERLRPAIAEAIAADRRRVEEERARAAQKRRGRHDRVE